MNYSDAKKLHKNQWSGGKYYGRDDLYVFPYNCHFEDDKFIEITVRPDQCITQEVDTDRINKYKKLLKNGLDLGPSWLIFGKRLKDGSISRIHGCRYYVVDGNHRLKAKEELGYKEINAIVPESCYHCYEKNCI